MKDIRAAAALRQREQRTAEDKLQKAMADMQDPTARPGIDSRQGLARRGYNKRSVMDVAQLTENENMDLDDPEEEPSRRVSKRKM